MFRFPSSELQPLEKKIAAMRDETYEGLPRLYTDFKPSYVGYHSRRFAMLVMMLKQMSIGPASRILDVGPTFSSILFHRELGCRVDSISFAPDESTPFGVNYHFDLNLSQDPADWRLDMGRYPVIVFAEVVEHLYTNPKKAFAYLRELIEPNGYLIVQTPNAVALRKRISLLLGKHPFEELSEYRERPGHFRESTLAELVRYATAANFDIVLAKTYNYFNPTYRQNTRKVSPLAGRLYYRLNDWVPGNLKPNCMLVLKRPPGS